MNQIAAPPVSSPLHPIPAGACDTHTHIFEPIERFGLQHPALYPLPLASSHVHAATRKRLNVAFGVLVQPAPYGGDPGAMLEAIASSAGALRGIATGTAELDDSTLESWAAGGIKGLRFTEMRAVGGNSYPGSVGFDQLIPLAPRMKALGMHAQLWAPMALIVDWLPILTALDLPIVIDHLGCPSPDLDVNGPIFRSMLAALRDGPLWIKLSLCRMPSGIDAARPFHDAFVQAAPERLLWGSDWPYVRMTPAPDAGRLLDLLFDWVDDPVLVHRILVENPAQLYGFDRKPGNDFQ